VYSLSADMIVRFPKFVEERFAHSSEEGLSFRKGEIRTTEDDTRPCAQVMGVVIVKVSRVEEIGRVGRQDSQGRPQSVD